jgi:hypothetical protein
MLIASPPRLPLPRRLLHQFLKRPQPIRHARRHGRGDAEALVLAHEIVVREVQRDSRAQVFDLLGKAVGQPRKPAHLHTQGQVLPRPGTGIPFPIMRGESPRDLDTELYGETNEKDSGGPRSLWPTHRFRVNSREVALPETDRLRSFLHFSPSCSNGV